MSSSNAPPHESVRPIPDRIQAGVELLDAHLPGWHNRVDLDGLDLRSTCRCVVGQLFHDAFFNVGLRDLGIYETLDDYLVDSDGREHRYGFDVSPDGGDDAEYDLLTDAWRNRIEAIRIADRRRGNG